MLDVSHSYQLDKILFSIGKFQLSSLAFGVGNGTGAVSSSLPFGDGVGDGPVGVGVGPVGVGAIGAVVALDLDDVAAFACDGAGFGRRLGLHGTGAAKHDTITDKITIKTTKV